MVQPRSLLSAFIFRCLDCIIHLLAISKISRLFCGSAGRFVSTLVANSEDRFSGDTAHTTLHFQSSWVRMTATTSSVHFMVMFDEQSQASPPIPLLEFDHFCQFFALNCQLFSHFRKFNRPFYRADEQGGKAPVFRLGKFLFINMAMAFTCVATVLLPIFRCCLTTDRM